MFICHCGINIGSVVNVPEVVEYAKTLPGVVYAEHNLYTCSQDTQERIASQIEEHGLNRVVVASCTPRTHEPLFQDTLRQAGLNPTCSRWPISASRTPGCIAASRRWPPKKPNSWRLWRSPRRASLRPH